MSQGRVSLFSASSERGDGCLCPAASEPPGGTQDSPPHAHEANIFVLKSHFDLNSAVIHRRLLVDSACHVGPTVTATRGSDAVATICRRNGAQERPSPGRALAGRRVVNARCRRGRPGASRPRPRAPRRELTEAAGSGAGPSVFSG